MVISPGVNWEKILGVRGQNVNSQNLGWKFKFFIFGDGV